MTKSRKNSGTKTDQGLGASLKGLREALIESGSVHVAPSDPPVSIDGRLDSGIATATYSVDGASITVDFQKLGHGMLVYADKVFAIAFGSEVGLGVSFPDGGSLNDAATHYISNSLKWVDGVAITALADHFIELILQGTAFAAESFADDLFTEAKTPFPQWFRKHLRNVAKGGAETLLSSRIPGVGRGGANRLADTPEDVKLVAFLRAIEQVYPFWKDVQVRALRGDETWRDDARKLPEFKRFTALEKRHVPPVLTLLQSKQKVNGARPEPRVLAREHARLIVGLPSLSDSKLRKLASRAEAFDPSDQSHD